MNKNVDPKKKSLSQLSVRDKYVAKQNLPVAKSQVGEGVSKDSAIQSEAVTQPVATSDAVRETTVATSMLEDKFGTSTSANKRPRMESESGGASESSSVNTSTDETDINPLVLKLVNKHEQDQKPSKLVELVWNFHGLSDYPPDNWAVLTLTKFMHNGKADATVDALNLLKVFKSHPCKYIRLMGFIYFVQDMKENGRCKALEIHTHIKDEEWSEFIREFVSSCLRVFGYIKPKDHLTKDCRSKMIHRMEKALLVAVHEKEGQCSKCIKLDWFKCYSKYILLMHKMIKMVGFVNPLTELIQFLCDAADATGVTIVCKITPNLFETLFIHCDVLSLWSGKKEESQIINTEISPLIVKNFVYLLYHDERSSNYQTYISEICELCKCLDIPNPWLLMNFANFVKMDPIPPNILFCLLRYPIAWINDPEILKNLNVAKMKIILESDDLNLEELGVFFLCQRWAKLCHSFEKSDCQLFAEVEKLIRIPLISSNDFIEHITNGKNVMLKVFTRNDIFKFYVSGTKLSTTTPREMFPNN